MINLDKMDDPRRKTSKRKKAKNIRKNKVVDKQRNKIFDKRWKN